MSGDAQPTDYVFADPALLERVAREWDWPGARDLRTADGFTIVATRGSRVAGITEVYFRELPLPLRGAVEAYIDDIRVAARYRRMGIARTMLRMAGERAREGGACQPRSWSTDDKVEAVQMWHALGFSMCPTTHAMWGQEIAGYFVARRLD